MNMANTVDEDVYITGPIINWVSGELCYPFPPLCIRRFATDFLQRCLSTPEGSVDTTLHSLSPTPLLREWAKLKLAGGSWREALVAALNVSLFFCSGIPRCIDTPLVWSLRPRGSQFTALSATVLKR